MIDLFWRATSFMSSRRLLILSFCIFILSSTLPLDATLGLSPEYLNINGQKSLGVMLTVIVYGSWRSGMAFHTKLCDRFSRNLVMTKRKRSRSRSVDGMMRPVLACKYASSRVAQFRGGGTLILRRHSVLLLAPDVTRYAGTPNRSERETFLKLL
jgi:hypothetical protein